MGTGTHYDGSSNFRLINETFFTDSVFFEVNYELIWASGDGIRKQLGRQTVTWGDGFVFNPMDLFNPFPPTAIDQDYKAGDDMVNAQFTLAQIGDVQFLYVARRDPENNKVESDQASLAGKLHYGLGKDIYPDALLDPDITERLARGELFVIGRNYLSGHIQVELHPLFKVFFTAINNIEDPSGILQPYVTWNITQNIQLTGGVNVYYGAKGTEFGGFKAPQTDFIIKSPDNVYIRLTYFF